jgi:diaminohydroxyphosphoribosylaminopyrimidine deaminase / 5-amino-6-(5-phosphoribosylamino)uracil reductase
MNPAYMREALDLARQGRAQASPNPMVGCVVARGGEVVGRGFHTYAGLKHAEIAALEEAGELARGSDVYVSLEPCSHTGRTGPCVEALIAAGVARVFAAMEDPNPRVSGDGMRKLRAAGIEVEVVARI